MYLLADVYIMHDLLKTGDVSRENMSLNQICLENVQEVKMKFSDKAVNAQNEGKKLARSFLWSKRNPY